MSCRAARVAVTLLALGAAPLAAQTESALAAPLPAFKAGETLVYEAKYGIFKVGTAMLHVAGIDTIRNAPMLHTVFVIKGGIPLYRLNDRMDSWFGLRDFASRRFVQDFHEGGSRRYTAYEIFPDSGFYRQEGVDSTLATSADPLDDLAFFYFARAHPLEVGSQYRFERYFRPDRNPVILTVVERDTLDVPAGRFPTIVVRPTVQGRGILAESSDPRMWISDDERRLIVQLKSKFSFGTITLVLKEIATAPPEDLLGGS
jgi:hypothetical protein